jgi:hypothetical protein
MKPYSSGRGAQNWTEEHVLKFHGQSGREVEKPAEIFRRL